MATTSLSLGSHWEDFIRREIATGRYASASEVVRAALRETHARHRARATDSGDESLSRAGSTLADVCRTAQGSRVDPIR